MQDLIVHYLFGFHFHTTVLKNGHGLQAQAVTEKNLEYTKWNIEKILIAVVLSQLITMCVNTLHQKTIVQPYRSM